MTVLHVLMTVQSDLSVLYVFHIFQRIKRFLLFIGKLICNKSVMNKIILITIIRAIQLILTFHFEYSLKMFTAWPLYSCFSPASGGFFSDSVVFFHCDINKALIFFLLMYTCSNTGAIKFNHLLNLKRWCVSMFLIFRGREDISGIWTCKQTLVFLPSYWADFILLSACACASLSLASNACSWSVLHFRSSSSTWSHHVANVFSS